MHTPKPVVDIAYVIPELSTLARTTVRLHPRRVKQDLPPEHSKVGGLILWPAHEAWPTCEEHSCPFVSVLQLRAEDVPELAFPDGTNYFQVLWCPNDHANYTPVAKVFWRKAPINDSLKIMPPPTIANECYVPHVCVLHPEQVSEYPHVMEAYESHPEIMEQIDSSDELNELAEEQDQDIIEDVATLYQFWLSVADGLKIGGYPSWSQYPNVPRCTCGQPMDYLLTITGSEFDGGTWQRWVPEEDRAVLENGDFASRDAVQNPTGLMLGRENLLNFFICRQCEQWPIKTVS